MGGAEMMGGKSTLPDVGKHQAAAKTKDTFAGSKLMSEVDYSVNQNRFNSASPTASEIATLKAQNERLRRERAEFIRIMGAASWAVNERLVYLTLRRLVANGRREKDWLVRVTPTWRVAQESGLSKRTCRDVMRRLQSADLIDWKVDRASDADYDEAITTIYVKERMPAAFAPLPATSRGESDKRRKVEYRARVKQLQSIVDELECPKCHKTGCMHVTIGAKCDKCKATISEDDLEKALGIDKLDKANQQKKLRKLKGKAARIVTTPLVAESATTPQDTGIIEPANWARDRVAESATTPPERALPHLNNNGVHCHKGSNQAVTHA